MIILNLITGHTLHSIIKHGTVQLTNGQRKKVVTDVISGLLYIHSKSVIHNDIKEDNIMIELRDEQVTSVLIDFERLALWITENTTNFHVLKSACT
jgi:serine/threonine protein kinase